MRGFDPDAVRNSCLTLNLYYKNHVNLPADFLVRLQGNVKVTGKGQKYTFCSFLFLISIFHCTSHQAISLTDLG